MEIGFSLVGIAGVSPRRDINDAYDRWLAAGMNGGMAFLVRHREKRRDPSLLLEGVRSAICVGINYYQDIEKRQRDADGSDGRGVFSIYAHGRDYHRVMETMLDRLAERIKDIHPGMRSLACADTKPISDRAMAIRAGIAWLGKNSNVISPQFGSWIFLGELLTNLELTPDPRLQTLCGDCTECIDACPTGALDEPFVVDSRKCISYLTVEKRGDIPAGPQESIGVRVFGCDTCQSACPFNDAAPSSVLFDREDRSPLIDMSLEALERISDEEFRMSTEDSAIRRCRPGGMRRNAAAVSKNVAARYGRRRRRGETPKT